MNDLPGKEDRETSMEKDTLALRQRYEKRISNLHAAGAYLREMRNCEEEALKVCNDYLVRELSYLEYLMEAVLLEMQRVKNADMDKEIFAVESDGKFRIIDFSTGRMKYVHKLSEEEFEEYINHRAGTKIY